MSELRSCFDNQALMKGRVSSIEAARVCRINSVVVGTHMPYFANRFPVTS